MENIDSNILQDFIKNNTDRGVIPTVNIFPQELVTAFTVGLYVISFVAVLFVLAYIVGIIRKWKVDSAILDMHRDIKDIKDLLVPAREREQEEPVIDKDTARIA